MRRFPLAAIIWHSHIIIFGSSPTATTAFSLSTSSSGSSADSTIVTAAIRSYTLHGDGIDSDRCTLHEIRPPPRDPREEEDEVEMYYPTSRRAFVFPHRATNPHNKILNVRQTSFGCGKLGATVWTSALALACLLANDDDGESTATIGGKRVLELGSGCGLPSLVAKEICHAEHVLATDYWEDEATGVVGNSGVGDRLVPKSLSGANLAYNIGCGSFGGGMAMNDDSTNASVRMLDWHDEMGVFKLANEYLPDLIIGSDLVYYPMDTTPLLQTLEILLKANGGDDGGTKNKEAFLILPLPPKAEREALPDFRTRLAKEGALNIDNCEVIMDELELVERRITEKGGNANYGEDDDDGKHKLLRVRIRTSY